MTHAPAFAAPADSSAAGPCVPVADVATGSVRRSVTLRVSGGFAGVSRVVMLLHSRHYSVTALSADVGASGESRVACTVLLPEDQVELLVARLRRMPAVVSAESA
jgi:hypothetical protein